MSANLKGRLSRLSSRIGLIKSRNVKVLFKLGFHMEQSEIDRFQTCDDILVIMEWES